MPTNPDNTLRFPLVTIREIALPHPGAIKIGPFGSQLKKEDLSREGYKIYGQENIIADDFSIGTRRIDATKFSALSSCRLFPGDLVLTMMGTIGKCAIFPKKAEIGIMDSHLLRIQINPEVADPHFIVMMISAEEVVGRQIERLSHGSIMSGLSSSIVQRLQIPLPPLTEQYYITGILDTINTQMQNTEQLIAKLKVQKTGILNDLLTRGLDKSGKLRDPIAHPEQFKVSVLGKIPKEWEIANLGTIILQNGGLIQTGPFGSQLHAHEYVAEGVPVIMPQDIQNGDINETQAAHITPERAKSLARHYVEFNDVIFARRGDLGRCTFIDTLQVGWICGTGCLLVRPPNSVDGRWLAAIYRHNYSQRQILARAVGSTMVNLNTTLLTDLIVAKPSLAEQVAIVEKIDILDMGIRTEEAYYNKLELYKKSLMQDLLSGVRKYEIRRKDSLES